MSAQAGIFVEGSAHHLFLEYDLPAGADLDPLRRALTQVVEAAQRQTTADASSLVVGFDDSLWRALAPAPDHVPEGLHPLQTIKGSGGTAPATQRSLFLWIHGARHDLNFDLALVAHRALRNLAMLELEEHGFTYLDSRDLTGFIDGTANPKDDDRMAAALVPEGQPGAGGSFVLTQRWVHSLDAFSELPIGEQERVIGRTKPDSIELEGDAMPADSHVSRTDLKRDGEALKLYRRSAPFGTLTEHGLYFLSFACDATRQEEMLKSMFGATGDGLHDRLVGFSKATTGSLFFAPCAEALAEVL